MRETWALIDHFFFRRISSSGFGLMRIAWAATTLAYLIAHAQDAAFYYSDAGVLPNELGYLVFRSEYRWTLLSFVTDPNAVMLLYTFFALAVACVLVGLWPRITTVLAVFLMFSFHERNLLPLGGGETTLRNIGFILAISPGIAAFSIDRAVKQWSFWLSSGGTLMKPHLMSIWPQRLMLWQLMVIYTTSMWDKLLGTMWLGGTAVVSALHHTHFTRWPMAVYDYLAPYSPLMSWYSVGFEMSWLLLLIPQPLLKEQIPFFRRHSLKRWILFGGVLFHGGIYVLMDVGSFSLAMLTAYFGLLVANDFEVYRKFFNSRFKRKVSVLYDGNCCLCRRSAFVLQLLDHLRRVKLVDFRDEKARIKAAPDIALQDLDRALHIRHRKRTEQGFYAFRYLCWHLPVFWPLVPLLYVPGVPSIGKRVYAKIAAGRDACAGGTCAH